MPSRPRKHNPFHVEHLSSLTKRERDYTREDLKRLSDPDLAKAREIRNSQRWKRLRLMIIRRNPLCADPFAEHEKSGMIEIATEVDHIHGLREFPELAFSVDNLQSLCHACHARKSLREVMDQRKMKNM